MAPHIPMYLQPSVLMRVGLSDYRAVGLSGRRTIGLSDYRPSDYRAVGLSAVGLSGCRTIGPSKYRAVTIHAEYAVQFCIMHGYIVQGSYHKLYHKNIIFLIWHMSCHMKYKHTYSWLLVYIKYGASTVHFVELGPWRAGHTDRTVTRHYLVVGPFVIRLWSFVTD